MNTINITIQQSAYSAQLSNLETRRLAILGLVHAGTPDIPAGNANGQGSLIDALREVEREMARVFTLAMTSWHS
jgi:hypothetical protein